MQLHAAHAAPLSPAVLHIPTFLTRKLLNPAFSSDLMRSHAEQGGASAAGGGGTEGQAGGAGGAAIGLRFIS